MITDLDISSRTLDLVDILRAIFRCDGSLLVKTWEASEVIASPLAGAPLAEFPWSDVDDRPVMLHGYKLLAAASLLHLTDEGVFSCMTQKGSTLTIRFTDTSRFLIDSEDNQILDCIREWLNV